MKWAWNILRAAALPLVPAIVLIVALELLVRYEFIYAFLVPAPTKVAKALIENADIWIATGWTGLAALIGFSISAIAGIVTAILLSSSKWVQRMFYPYAVFFQTVPIIAIAPLLVIWIGFDIRTVIASACIVSFFPVVANTLSGLLSTEPALRDLFRLYNAGPIATFWKLRLPSALPNILTGLRIAGGLAVIGAIVGEFITGTGIGDVIAVSRQMQRVDKIYAVLLLAAGLGLVLLAGINLASALLLRNWHPSEGKS